MVAPTREKDVASSDYLNNLAKRAELDSICEANKLDKTAYYVNWVKDDIVQNPLLTIRQYGLKFFQSQSFIISPLIRSNKSNYVKYGVHIYINSINYVLIFFSIAAIVVFVETKEIPADDAFFVALVLVFVVCFCLSFRATVHVSDASRFVVSVCFLCELSLRQEGRSQSVGQGLIFFEISKRRLNFGSNRDSLGIGQETFF